MTLMALGTMPVDHPLSLGMLGMHAARSTNLIMQQADLLIVLGARFDDRAIGRQNNSALMPILFILILTRQSWGKSVAHIWQ